MSDGAFCHYCQRPGYSCECADAAMKEMPTPTTHPDDERGRETVDERPGTPSAPPTLTLHDAIKLLLDDYQLADHIEMVRDDAKYDESFQGLSSEHPRVQRFRDVIETLRAAINT
jgi:hypothetical protein